jgi:GH24 family phage-related lysozyme (muramidase)
VSYAIDRAGLDLILSLEGYLDVVYADSRGLATVGVGHLIHMGYPTAHDHAQYDHKGRAFYEQLLRSDVERDSIGPMNHYLHRALNQNQVNAVASAAFNCGPGFIYGSVGQAINRGDMQGAADAFMRWVTPSVLYGRRVHERNLFLTPVKAGPRDSVPLPWLTPTERRWCLELDKLTRDGRGTGRRRVLHRVIGVQARRVADAARKHGGWDVQHRRQRYHSLIARA